MIRQIRLQNFRSHVDFLTDFSPGITVLIGENGIGKTSVIEAIYIALKGKSWRSNFQEILREEKKNPLKISSKSRDIFSKITPQIPNKNVAEWWRIDLLFSDQEKRVVKFFNNKKQFEIDGQIFARLPKKMQKSVVLFEPNDLQLLYGSPSRRRDFFDRFINEIFPDHQTFLNKFEKVLRQRNNLLKKENFDKNELFIWDLQFADLSEKISSRRKEITKILNENLTKKYQEISGKTDEISLKYLPGGPSSRKVILQKLSENENLFMTKIGAQKDDFQFFMNQKNAKTSASRGENRTIIFAILAEQIAILREKFGEVFAILDDIDSELDAKHKENLYQLAALADNNLFATTLEFSHAKNVNVIEIK